MDARSVALPLALVVVALLSAANVALAQSPDPTGLASVIVSSALRQEIRAVPGVVRHGSITLSNTGEADALVSISQADMGFSPEGEIEFLPSGKLDRSNAGWIDVAPQAVVPANSSLDVPFTIAVPDDPSLNGSYWSLLQVQPLDPSVVREQSADASVTTTINVRFQYSVTVLTHIGTPERNSIQFTDPLFAPDDDGHYYLQVGLTNSGAFVVETGSWLELYDSDGMLVKRVEGQSARTYPGATDRLTFELGSLQHEVYQAVVVADAGGNSVFGARYNLDATVR
ncbi:MAG TPA: hypothetical protein VF168_09210 [Trueperaceae bacterium]